MAEIRWWLLARLRRVQSWAMKTFGGAEYRDWVGDRERMDRLARYRDQREAQVRGEVPESRVFSRDDADYLRILASYGGRMVSARWLCEEADKIDATLNAMTATSEPEGERDNG